MSRRKRRQKTVSDEPATPPSAPKRLNRPFAEALQGLRDQLPAHRPKPPAPGPKPPAPEAPRGAKAPPSKKGADRSGVPDPSYGYEDRVAWQQARTGVAPLPRRRSEPLGKPEAKAWPEHGPHGVAPPPNAPADEAEARARLASLVGGGVRFRVHREDDGYVEATRVGAPASALRPVTRSDVAPEAQIDLHGMHADEAERALSRFVRTRYRAGDRLLLVVHGKGRHSDGGIGVLADRAVRALTEGAAAPLVIAFASAPLRLGGTGALVVQLVPR